MQRPCFTDEKKELLSLIDELQIGLYQFDLKGVTCFQIFSKADWDIRKKKSIENGI